MHLTSPKNLLFNIYFGESLFFLLCRARTKCNFQFLSFFWVLVCFLKEARKMGIKSGNECEWAKESRRAREWEREWEMNGAGEREHERVERMSKREKRRLRANVWEEESKWKDRDKEYFCVVHNRFQALEGILMLTTVCNNQKCNCKRLPRLCIFTLEYLCLHQKCL